MDVIEKSETGTPNELESIADGMTQSQLPCYLYCVRNGKFEFAQELK